MSETDIQQKKLNADDLVRIVAENPDQRYELIEGELITMSLRGMIDGVTKARLMTFIAEHVLSNKTGHIVVGRVGFYTRGSVDTVRAPDVAVIARDVLPADLSQIWYVDVAPELVVEVASPGDTGPEIEAKVQEWLDFGVQMVWVAYPNTRRLHVYGTAITQRILNADDTLDGGEVLPGFSVTVSECFSW